MRISDYISLLSSLVGFNTISSTTKTEDHSNFQLINFAQTFFEQHGFKTETYTLDNGKYNLLASYGTSDGGVLLAGHSDTVPCTVADWSTNPFILTLKNNNLYGLGSCDMKGFIALMLYIAATLDKSTIKKRLSFLITADEETSMCGAQDFVRQCHSSYDLIIVGEPTELTPIVAHKGYMCEELHFKGKACHSSNPALGINAISMAYDAIGLLEQLQEDFKSYHDERFHVPYPTLNLGAIHGGDSSNRVCDYVKLLFDVRPMGSIDTVCVNKKLDALVDKLNVKYENRVQLVKSYGDTECFDNKDQKLVSMLEQYIGKHSICEAYCTEASFLQQLGPVIVYGPGSIKCAHMIDEHIAIDEVKKAYETMTKILQEFVLY